METIIKQNNKKHLQIELSKFVNFLALEIENVEKNSKDQIIGLEIISDTKLTTPDLFSAKGNVTARTNNMVLKADEFEYNSKFNIIVTGGFAHLFTDTIAYPSILDKELTLKGLISILKNKK